MKAARSVVGSGLTASSSTSAIVNSSIGMAAPPPAQPSTFLSTQAARAARLEEALRGIHRMADRMRGARGRVLEQQARDLIAHVTRLRAEMERAR